MNYNRSVQQGGEPRNVPGKGRKNRVGLSLETSTQISLERLAVSCRMSPTTLAYLMVKHCLNDGSVVDLFQMDYNRNPAYWCIPMTQRNGERRLEVIGK